jgi:hypothetical protein
MYRKHYLPHMWEANLERLQRSDPDLFAYLSPTDPLSATTLG